MRAGLVILGIMMPIFMYPQFGTGYNHTDNKHERRWHYASFSIDPAQALYGSKKNDPGLNFIIKVGARDNRRGEQLTVFYEQFSLINYQSFGFQPSYVIYKRNNLDLLIGSELSIIRRPWISKPSYAFSLKLEYHLRDIFFGLMGDLKRRTDIQQAWGYSNYLEIGYKF